MIGYLLDGVGPATAAEDVRMHRLLQAGPWQYQPQASGGTLATWKAAENAPRAATAFGTPRQTTDGLLYYPPAVLPRPEALLRPAMAHRDDAHKVDVETGEGLVTLCILPAYASPRRVLDNNLYGDYTAAYARKARALIGKMKEHPDTVDDELYNDLFEVARCAIMHTTRCTRELITDCGWLTEESAWAIWGAIIQVPKDLQKSDPAPSAPNTSAAV